MKKVFKALGPSVVGKRWIEDSASVPEGFHETICGALAAWKEPEAIVDAPIQPAVYEPIYAPVVKRRGRPPKV